MSDKPENRFLRLFVIAAVASIAIAPLTFYGCGPEWARWDATQANMYFRRGETEDALYQLRDAIRKSPRDPSLKLNLAKRLIEIDQPEEALDLANQVLEVFPDNANAVSIISSAYQHLGDFKSALQASRRIIAGGNELAYYRALAKTDLPLAKEDIESVIESQNRYISWQGDEELSLGVKATAMASMVARCCDLREEAIATISQQVGVLRSQVQESQLELNEHIYGLTQDSFPVRQDSATLRLQKNLNRHERRLAVLLSCRALLHQDLGNMSNCSNDRLDVAELGFDSSEILKALPDERLSLAVLGAPTAFLDTQGFIYSLLPWDETLASSDLKKFFSSYGEAVRDLNIAILCNEVSRKSLDCPLGNSMELIQQNKAAAMKAATRQSAVLLYHRLQLHQRGGKEELALRDEKRIRELGFEPGPSLY